MSEEPKAVFKFEIVAYDNGNVSLNGPAVDLLVFNQIFISAQKAYVDGIARKIAEERDRRIIVPEVQPPKGLKLVMN